MSECQQVFSGLQDSPKYSSWFLLRSGLDADIFFSDFQFPNFLFLTSGDCSKETNKNSYLCSIFQLFDKIQEIVYHFIFFFTQGSAETAKSTSWQDGFFFFFFLVINQIFWLGLGDQ